MIARGSWPKLSGASSLRQLAILQVMRFTLPASARPILSGLYLLAGACGGESPAGDAPDGGPSGIAAEIDSGSTAAGSADRDCDRAFSQFAGDCARLEPPDPADGFQLHYGPLDHDDPDAVEPFLLEPGGERVDCQFMHTPNAEPVLYDAYRATMRPGTHHLILYNADHDHPDRTLGPCGEAGGIRSRWIFAAQGALATDSGGIEFPPPDRPVPPENEGLAFRMPARAGIAFQLHYVNGTEEPLLREAWANVYSVEPSEELQLADPITFFGGLSMNIPPRSREIIPVSCPVPPDTASLRIVELWPHMHAHGERLTAWKVSASGERLLVYETYDWAEPAALLYDSVQQNPLPDPATGAEGGHSGLLTLGPGDRIEYECEVDNTLDIALRFANEAYTAEMCNLFGTYTPSTGSAWRCIHQ